MTFMDEIDRMIAAALAEDIGPGDLTSRLVVPAEIAGKGIIHAKAEFVLAGMDTACRTFEAVDAEIQFNPERNEGDSLKPGDVIARVEGRLRSLLEAERTALNFLQRASGIATLTAMYVEKIKGTKSKILDTRKTAPGLRIVDKAAVRAGGGFNHRVGLFDGILIKDNHIAAAGGVCKAVGRAKAGAPHPIRIEVEVTNFEQLDEAVDSGADIVMLDNMSIDKIVKAVKQVAGRVPLEVSGNVSLDTVAEIARTGVDYISVGALTHSVIAADISMNIEKA